MHLAAELVVDAVVQPEDLRDELVRRLALAASRVRDDVRQAPRCPAGLERYTARPLTGCSAVRLARLTGGQEVAGSNPASPTTKVQVRAPTWAAARPSRGPEGSSRGSSSRRTTGDGGGQTGVSATRADMTCRPTGCRNRIVVQAWRGSRNAVADVARWPVVAGDASRCRRARDEVATPGLTARSRFVACADRHLPALRGATARVMGRPLWSGPCVLDTLSSEGSAACVIRRADRSCCEVEHRAHSRDVAT